ncbi:peptidase C25-like protein [Mucilaginibacter gracilis]|uniref:Peptidase C25-like protein n=1 Tax=Mucilaginibacter gracilis TaxID=423350 RepID=A0A495IV95_9SPHI|nr:C25 family cysteine peptidase [Mucilaginibacter gracilis]RKR80393.1 peptidase C25-like protein [Mucilaginibacter gracilis]
MAKKLILSIKSKLLTKYTSSINALEAVLHSLIASDQQRGITSILIYIDQPTAASDYGFPVMTTVSDTACKQVIDSLFRTQQPDYIVLFGADDVFPFFLLDNHLHTIDKDVDQTVPSDYPYACDAPASRDATTYTNPIRVIGRIPDLPGIADLAYVQGLVNDIIQFRSAAQSDYQSYFAISAAKWINSSLRTAQNIFNDSDSVLPSPPQTSNFQPQDLQPLSHYFNCHGRLNAPDFLGELNGNTPVCLSPANLNGNIRKGTVVVAECCYGAQLLNPLNFGISVASNYLKNHAIAFMGSTTMSFGMINDQDQADLLSQYFFKNVMNGASTGRALLAAKIFFLKERTPNPVSFKTLAQFTLLGDPSVQPVAAPVTTGMLSTLSNRRLELISSGLNLGVTVPRPVKVSENIRFRPPAAMRAVLKQLFMTKAEHEMIFDVENSIADTIFATQALPTGISPAASQKVRFRVYQQKEQEGVLPSVRLVVIKEAAGEILGYKEYVSH